MGHRINPALCQQISFTNAGSTACSNAVNSDEVVLYATQDCFINLATSPTATATGAANIFVPANTWLELSMSSRLLKIAARGSTTSGVLYINAIRS